ncbi:hypothetical protein MRX96_006471 [Rhipicephalus microplus]
MGQAGVGDIARRRGPWWGIQRGATRYPRARITRGGEQPEERADDDTEEGDDASPKNEEPPETDPLLPRRWLPLTMAGWSTRAAAIYDVGPQRRGEPGEGLREEEPVRLFFYLRGTLCFYYFELPLLLCVAFARVLVRAADRHSPPPP